MSLTTKQLERLNRLKLLVTYRVDEYSESVENLNSDDINFGDLEAELHDAAKKVLTSVERQHVFRSAVSANSFVSAIAQSEKGCALVPLPVDYLRFVRLKIAGWKTASNGLLPDNSSAYRLQQHTLHRGTKEKPKSFRVPYFGGDYVAGTVPAAPKQVYATVATIEDGATINVGDTCSGDGVTLTVKDVSDPDYIILDNYTIDATDNLAVGSTLTKAGAFTLTVKFMPGDNYTRPTHKDAIEAYPTADGTIEEFVYVPALKAYDVPDDLEDPLVWYATYRMLLINERFEGAKAAEAEFMKSLNFINTGLKGEEYEQRG